MTIGPNIFTQNLEKDSAEMIYRLKKDFPTSAIASPTPGVIIIIPGWSALNQQSPVETNTPALCEFDASISIWEKNTVLVPVANSLN